MNQQKVAFITGVSTGIGHGLCKYFLSQNWKVFGSVRKIEDAQILKDQFADFHAIVMDVTDNTSIENAVKEIGEASPAGINVLINNAGIAVGGPLVYVPIAEFKYQFEVNVFGMLQVIQHCRPLLLQNENKAAGRIIQISSVSGKIGFPFLGPYVSSKFAVEGLSETLRRELFVDQIKVIVVGPGAVKTPIWEKSVQPVEEKYQETEYSEAIQKLNQQFVKASIKTGLTVEYLSQKIYGIAVHPTPKVRYTFMAKKLTNYILPKILPAKWIDRILRRQLFK